MLSNSERTLKNAKAAYLKWQQYDERAKRQRAVAEQAIYDASLYNYQIPIAEALGIDQSSVSYTLKRVSKRLREATA